jgi:hypothetical protein
MQGWRWAWVRDIRALVFAPDAGTARQQPWRPVAYEAAQRCQERCIGLFGDNAPWRGSSGEVPSCQQCLFFTSRFCL